MGLFPYDDYSTSSPTDCESKPKAGAGSSGRRAGTLALTARATITNEYRVLYSLL